MEEYKTKGVCCRKISFEIEDDKIKEVHFEGGCHGNLVAISRLVQGMEAAKAAEILTGVDCGGRGTSCTDQFAIALKEHLAK
ncbi:MAG: TIGR03905 family TSCPD domain-containing protein [Firmicutes bacterium]|nr:TIGR03905 family TSCPD domain-containing protein [Bacillota bacterium]